MRKVLTLFGFTLAAAVGVPAEPPQTTQPQGAQSPPQTATDQGQQESTFDFRAPPGGFGAQHGQGGQFNSRTGGASNTARGPRTESPQPSAPPSNEAPVNR